MAPPADLRYLERPKAKCGDSELTEARGDVISFLEALYESVAETLPDFKDEILTPVDQACDVSRSSDPYAEEKEFQTEALLGCRTRKPRKAKRQIQINLDRTSKHFEERWLPPSTMKEYYEQYQIQSALPKPASFPTFWRAHWLDLAVIMLLFYFVLNL